MHTPYNASLSRLAFYHDRVSCFIRVLTFLHSAYLCNYAQWFLRLRWRNWRFDTVSSLQFLLSWAPDIYSDRIIVLQRHLTKVSSAVFVSHLIFSRSRLFHHSAACASYNVNLTDAKHHMCCTFHRLAHAHCTAVICTTECRNTFESSKCRAIRLVNDTCVISIQRYRPILFTHWISFESSCKCKPNQVPYTVRGACFFLAVRVHDAALTVAEWTLHVQV